MNFKTLLLSFILIASFNVFSQENENAQVDLLFLKIQELESEIAELRNIIESQDYLIQKLIKESVSSNEAVSTNETNLSDLPLDNNVKFSGIDDTKSKEEIYTAAIKSLEKQDLERASILFKYFVENFNDDEKSPLSYFWLGEIALIENNLDISNSYFLELVSIYPSHYRTPLAHKKIGDIFLKMNELDKAKDKYNYVIREYPNDTASSLALQLLKNME
ncbi:MAG: tol-pal system protein [SAR86 cluster bacterium]|uniref:Tol-pal system protein n=1 Tax=SAR86 cluster bacterium TaxID=2030880 RepID=A0A937I8Z6_9GAMM|nr:tol-pal system protein [SAR86 cluster bacterium]MDA1037886.1 tol-pal system protein [Pseudomonadota bacterium]